MKKYLILLFLLASRASALVLISESRSVFADYAEASIERSQLITSSGNFGVFNATAIGIPFGGGFASATQTSNITSSGFTLQHGTQDFYGPGAVARSLFSFTFALTVPSRITLSGYSNFFSGIASLSGVPLVWGPPGDFYRNSLEVDQLLPAGTYTFTSEENMRGDGAASRYTLLDHTVPDAGNTGLLMGLVLLVYAIVRLLS